jgi:hypothetical protein
MTDSLRIARIRRLMDELGVDEEEAAFIVSLSDGEVRGDLEMDDDERTRLGLEPWPIPAPAASQRR